jgi:hypothetical protein
MTYRKRIISARRLWQAREKLLYGQSISSVTEDGHAGVFQHLRLDKDHHTSNKGDGTCLVILQA